MNASSGRGPDDARLVDFTMADLVDAMQEMHRHRCHVLGLVSPTPDRVLFGPCVTISYFPTCHAVRNADRYNFRALFDEATASMAKGSVLVLASNGHPDTSLGGGTKLHRVARDQLAGVVADGRLRDFDELAAAGVNAWCRGEALQSGADTMTPFQANVPVILGGVGVMPGDHILADRSGVVAIPAGELEEATKRARSVAERHAHLRERIRTRAAP